MKSETQGKDEAGDVSQVTLDSLSLETSVGDEDGEVVPKQHREDREDIEPPQPMVELPPLHPPLLEMEEFRGVLWFLLALSLPLLLLLLVESRTARFVLGGSSLATIHEKFIPASTSSSLSFPTINRGGRLPILPSTVGAIFVAFRNPRSAIRAMRTYREAYPEGDLVVGCDDGCYNFSAAVAHFGGVWDGRPRRFTTKTDPGWYVRPPHAVTLLKALAGWLPHIRSRTYMVLETDVVVERRVTSSNLTATMNGCVCPPKGWFLGGESVFCEKLNPSYHPSHWPEGHVPYGGQGGSIINTRFMRAVVGQPPEHLANDLALFFGCSTTVGVDYFVSALVHRYNGSVGGYPGYLNWFVPDIDGYDRYIKGDIEVMHPDKTEYNQVLGPEDYAILGPHWNETLTVPAEEPWETPRVHTQCHWEDGTGAMYRMGSLGLEADARERGEVLWD